MCLYYLRCKFRVHKVSYLYVLSDFYAVIELILVEFEFKAIVQKKEILYLLYLLKCSLNSF